MFNYGEWQLLLGGAFATVAGTVSVLLAMRASSDRLSLVLSVFSFVVALLVLGAAGTHVWNSMGEIDALAYNGGLSWIEFIPVAVRERSELRRFVIETIVFAVAVWLNIAAATLFTVWRSPFAVIPALLQRLAVLGLVIAALAGVVVGSDKLWPMVRGDDSAFADALMIKRLRKAVLDTSCDPCEMLADAAERRGVNDLVGTVPQLETAANRCVNRWLEEIDSAPKTLPACGNMAAKAQTHVATPHEQIARIESSGFLLNDEQRAKVAARKAALPSQSWDDSAPKPSQSTAQPPGVAPSPSDAPEGTQPPSVKVDGDKPKGKASVVNVTVGTGGNQLEIRKVINGGLDSFKACYEDGLQRDATLRGMMHLRLVLDREGRVMMAGEGTGQDVFADREVAGCVNRMMRKLTFSAMDQNLVVVRLTLSFDRL